MSVLAVGFALQGCAATQPAAPPVAVASSTPVVVQPVPDPAASASASALTPASASPSAKGALIFDQAPQDAAEVYEDDVPIAVDAGEPVPADAGVHKIAVVMKGLVVWSAKIRVPADGVVHVRIPPQYATAYSP